MIWAALKQSKHRLWIRNPKSACTSISRAMPWFSWTNHCCSLCLGFSLTLCAFHLSSAEARGTWSVRGAVSPVLDDWLSIVKWNYLNVPPFQTPSSNLQKEPVLPSPLLLTLQLHNHLSFCPFLRSLRTTWANKQTNKQTANQPTNQQNKQTNYNFEEVPTLFFSEEKTAVWGSCASQQQGLKLIWSHESFYWRANYQITLD